MKKQILHKSSFLFLLLIYSFFCTVLSAEGLTGKYYNKDDFSSLKITRTDPTINFEWGNASPSTNMGGDTFSVTWTGYIYFPENSTYTFYLAHDDRMTLTIDGTELYNGTSWTRGSDKYNTSTSKYYLAGYYPITITFVEDYYGAYAKFAWKNTNSISSQTIVPSTNLFTTLPNLADLELTEKTLPSPLTVGLDENITIPITLNNAGTLDTNASTIITITYNLDINVSEITPATDFNCSMSSGLLSAGSPITCTRTTDIIAGTTDLDFTFIVKPQEYGKLIQTSVASLASPEIHLTNNTLNSTPVQVNQAGYCKSHGYSAGFYIIDPDGGDDINSFEIYCTSDGKDVIKLPISDEMNTAEFSNFTFKSSISDDKNYYNRSHPKTFINYIRINANTLTLIPDDTPGFFNGDFSSLNLRGTPFTFDWEHLSNSDIQGCSLDKMRLDYDSSNKSGGQTLKINPKREDVYKCSSNSLKLKILDEYKYLKYLDKETLYKSCKELSINTPDTGDFQNITGYFYIFPKGTGPEDEPQVRVQDALLKSERPFVTYCMEVTESNSENQYSWTMFLNLDGKRTSNHDDIINGVDTCTNLGLIFFAPNTKTTFDKVKAFLYSQKNQWKEYTGKMSEYFTDRNINGWGSSNEVTRDYWPYGPLGLYYDDGSESDGILDPGAAGSWTEITGGIDVNGTKYGYDLTSTSMIGSTSININHMSTGTGWKTTLEDLNISNDFWITTYSAGGFHNSAPACTGGNTDACYLNGNPSAEPNGDYNYGNWMHFWADDNGDIYHYNDQWNNNKYTHDHYMCIAKDNYETVTRFGLTNGPFSVIESGQILADNIPINALDLNITTKIVNESLNFDLVKFNTTRTKIDKDQNISAGLYLVEIKAGTTVTSDQVNDLHYFGTIGGANEELNTSLGYLHLDASLWQPDFSANKITSAKKQVLFEYKYCAQDNLAWKDCWVFDPNTQTASCPCTVNDINCLCRTADSNDFAIRPKNFALSSLDGVVSGNTLIVKAADVNITYVAYDNDGLPSTDYNASFTELNTDINLIDTGLSCSTAFLEDTNQSAYRFENGKDSHSTLLSDVGIYNFILQEIPGQEFALVDAQDTPDTDRYITPNNMTLTIKPDHFRLSSIPNVNHNTDGNFTYLAKMADMESMAAKVDFNVTAENSTNGTAENYSTDCYAYPVNLDINFSVPTGTANNTLYYIAKDKLDNNVTLANNQTATSDLSFIKAGDTLPKTLFTTDTNGTAEVSILFNFGRENNTTVNPFVINLNNINISDQNTPIVVNSINQTLNQDATFVYGRVAGPKRAGYTNCVDNDTNCNSTNNDSPRIIFQIYKDSLGSVVPALNGATHDGTQDNRWWTSPFHNFGGVLKDGNITTSTKPNITEITGITGNHVTQHARIQESNFRYREELHYDGADGYVKEAHMKHYPSPWLVYDENNASATYNTFNFNFIIEGWSGVHEGNTTTTTQPATRSSKRIIW
jgi:hypothetical protein